VWKRLYKGKLTPKFRFEVGDRVRVLLSKGVFGKGYTPRFSKELFKVVERIGRTPPVYTLEGEKGDEIIGKWLEVNISVCVWSKESVLFYF
jgi:hypothetical protein